MKVSACRRICSELVTARTCELSP